jgi:hypothetical protein
VTNQPSSPCSSPAAASRGPANRASRKKHRLQGGTGEANRAAVAILEVLAGLRTPAEAAQALRVSLPRYYVLETRALEGLVAACEPKPLGKQPSPATRLASLEKELQQARRECARQQALVRVAQRSVGLPSLTARPDKQVAEKPSAKPDQTGRKRRPRRPTVRALRAAKSLRENSSVPAAADGLQPSLADRSAHGKSLLSGKEQDDGSQGKETAGAAAP